MKARARASRWWSMASETFRPPHGPCPPSNAQLRRSSHNFAATLLRAEGERGIALLKTRWKALNRIRLCPRRIGAITKAALVLTRAERPIR